MGTFEIAHWFKEFDYPSDNKIKTKMPNLKYPTWQLELGSITHRFC